MDKIISFLKEKNRFKRLKKRCERTPYNLRYQ